MKFAVAASVALSGAASALNHFHGHAHRNHPRSLEGPTKYVVEEHVEVTVRECWLDGRLVSSDECDEGVRNGTLIFLDEGYNKDHPKATSLSTYLTTPTPVPEPSPSPSKYEAPPPPPPKEEYVPPPPPVQAQGKPSYGGGGHGGGWADDSNALKEFPDGQIDCGVFPSEYGAVPLKWLNIGGWASVQKPAIDIAAGYNDIMTVTKSQCQGETCCLEGSFCSYACPSGYLKTQWPSKQGVTGQSIGGLYCQGGKLRLSKPEDKYLCVPGHQDPKVTVKNTLGQNVAICRTNYPGDEGMYIPVDVTPGETKGLACPDGAKYFKTWEGQQTSAQYYINMPGYPVEKACTWGNHGDDFGNWAPANIGVGFRDGTTWISIFANLPTQPYVKLPYTVEIVGGSSKCRYQNGMYCTGNNYDVCNDKGCTVSATSGELQYILS